MPFIVGGDGLGVIVAFEQPGFDGVHIPDGPVGEDNRFDLVSLRGEEVIDGDAVGAVARRDNQAVVGAKTVGDFALQDHIFRTNAFTKSQSVDVTGVAAAFIERVFAVPGAEEIGVAAVAAFQRVVAGTSPDIIIRFIATECIIAIITKE